MASSVAPAARAAPDGGDDRDYAAAYEAFVDALWEDDGAAVAGLLAPRGPLSVDDVFAYAPAMPYQKAMPGVAYVSPWGGRLGGGGRLPVALTRTPPPTPLGQAVAMGAVDVARVLVSAGAAPWPTPEALLDTALALLPAVAVVPDDSDRGDGTGGDGRSRPIDAVGLSAFLLDTFPASDDRRRDRWDMSPLAVLRNALVVGFDPRSPGRARNQARALLPRLLERYSPDEAAAATALPGVDEATIARVSPLSLGGAFFEPDDWKGYDRWRAARARRTERESLGADLDVLTQSGAALPRSSLADLGDLLSSVQGAYEDAQRREGRGRRGGRAPQESWSPLADMTPLEVQRLLYTRAPTEHYGAERARMDAERMRLLYGANGCAEHLGCASMLVDAIARDDPREVTRLLAVGRGIGAGAPIDGHRLRTAGNPVAFVRWATRTPSGASETPRMALADAGMGLAGDVYTTPMAIASAAGALDALQVLIDAGARPWPSAETVLAPALARALAHEVASQEATNAGASRPRLLLPAPGDSDGEDGRDPGAGSSGVRQWWHRARPFDAALVAKVLLGAFPRRSGAGIGPWDLNPLTVARANAVRDAATMDRNARTAGGGRRRSADGEVERRLVQRLVRTLSALLDAGYDPREPTAGAMMRVPHVPPRDVAPTELAAARWDARRTRPDSLAGRMARAAADIYEARLAWAGGYGGDSAARTGAVASRVDTLGPAAWVLVGDEPDWAVSSDVGNEEEGDDTQGSAGPSGRGSYYDDDGDASFYSLASSPPSAGLVPLVPLGARNGIGSRESSALFLDAARPHAGID
jgi:hypothetical protein